MPAQFPLPHWLIFDAPTLQTAPGPVYRITVILAAAYWRSGCSHMPTDEISLAALCRVPPAHLRPAKDQVRQALATILPALDRAHANAARLHAVQVAQTRRMAAAKTEKQAARSLARAADQTSQQAVTIPTLDQTTPASRSPLAHETDTGQLTRLVRDTERDTQGERNRLAGVASRPKSPAAAFQD